MSTRFKFPRNFTKCLVFRSFSLPRVRFAPPDPWISARSSAHTPDGHPPERPYRRQVGKRRRTGLVVPVNSFSEDLEESIDIQEPVPEAEKASYGAPVHYLPHANGKTREWHASQTWIESPEDDANQDESEDIDVMPDKFDIYNAYNYKLGEHGWVLSKKFRKDVISSATSEEDHLHFSPETQVVHGEDRNQAQVGWAHDSCLYWPIEAEQQTGNVSQHSVYCL